MSGIVWTEKNKCKQCYACVRQCKVKAVRVKNGQAEILQDRCVACGNCVKVCSQNAKIVESDIKKTFDILHGNEMKVAALAPSFPAVYKNNDLAKVICALKKLGFDEVWEVAVGAELITAEYKKLLKNNHSLIISSACPAVINLIEKHYPSLIVNLAPVVSPMIATGRLIKLIYPQTKVVFIGPCIAKKDEIKKVKGVDAVLTFQELEDMFSFKNIKIRELDVSSEEYSFDSPTPQSNFKGFPISGGLSLCLEGSHDLIRDMIVVDGNEESVSCIESVEKLEFSPRFIDILMCEGCIKGPYFRNSNAFVNWEKVELYIKESKRCKNYSFNDFVKSFNKVSSLNLSRYFTNRKVSLKDPSEEEIKMILSYTKKTTKEDELDCGACGYNSCRDKAFAVYNGLAEKDMCLPFLLSKEIEEKKATIELNREMNAMIESLYDGILVTDGNGKTLRVNRAFSRFLGKSPESLIGMGTKELEEKRIVYPSLAQLVLKEKRRLTVLQETGSGRKILSTANPIFDEEGNAVRVVINSRDMDDLNRLSREVMDAEKLKKYLEKNLEKENIGPLPRIVSISQVMEDTIKLSLRIAAVNTTVLILGESGVGKGLIARFIHENSLRNKGPFIKINCGSIPESLLESELFGYETGAFTGAKREGKPGLVELAHKGTLLLDEIADLPLNLQVKLLQVIQERELTRIGGTKPIRIDIRIIASTNKDIRKMVKQGEFREDLYYRLNVIPITIPPLRERKEDIELLIDFFISHYNKKHNKSISLQEDVIEALLQYCWPGNVRELENLMERLVVTSEMNHVTVEELPSYITGEKKNSQKVKVIDVVPLKEAVEIVESQLLKMAQERCNTTYEIAKLLGVNQSTVVRKIRKLFRNK
ncbi:MAG: sigma 54-interacting transcriptional regulator [Tepidanaerobacteraceae bacterium]